MTDESPLAAERKAEALQYVQNFYRRSWDWRSQSFHNKWDKFDRNYHSIYDPEKAANKEDWQATAFIGVTVQNVELIVSQIHKTMMSPHPPIQTEAGPAGDDLQAKLIEEVMDYELRKALFDVNFYDVLKEAVKYGSGFIKLYWEKIEDTRRRRMPVEESPMEVLDRAGPESLQGGSPLPQPDLKGFQFQNVQVLLKNCLAAKYIHIRDIFPEPNTTAWDKIIHRDKITYGSIVEGIRRGEFFDVRDQIEELNEGERFESDMQDVKYDRGYYDTSRQMAKFEKRHTIWELWAPVPVKWINFEMPEGDEAEVLIPAKLQVVSGVALLSSEMSEKFDGEVPILKLDYIRTGETYGKGIPELIQDEQEEMNEIRNQRVDNVNLILNKGIAVLESLLVNAEQDLVSKPGWVVRLKRDVDDVRKAIMPIEFQDVTASAYRETLEIERGIQERTGANRVTLGSSGEVKDTNQTLGGMELLRQMFNERIAAYGMVMESAFILRVAEKIYGLIYQELSPEELKPILGEEPITISEIPNPLTGQLMPVQVPRYLAFAFVPPEEVYRSYRFKPTGVFSLENKIVKAAQFMDWVKMFAPFLNMPEAAKYSAKLMGNDEAEKMILPMPPMPMAPPMGGPMGPPPPGKGAPGLKGGPNGNGPSFLPQTNPVRREPVVA